MEVIFPCPNGISNVVVEKAPDTHKIKIHDKHDLSFPVEHVCYFLLKDSSFKVTLGFLLTRHFLHKRHWETLGS
jgi:hypothetical protein